MHHPSKLSKLPLPRRRDFLEVDPLGATLANDLGSLLSVESKRRTRARSAKRRLLCRCILREDGDQQARHPSRSTTEELGSNRYFAIAGVLVALVGRL
jgi:hypothetical protein